MSAPRFPAKAPPGFCRGCGARITDPRRRTWCSDACKRERDPFWVKRAVKERDKVCQGCGGPALSRWERIKAGVKGGRWADCAAEYDHVVPHSEGGPFTAANVRLLCRKCHLARTAAWRRARKNSAKSSCPATT